MPAYRAAAGLFTPRSPRVTRRPRPPARPPAASPPPERPGPRAPPSEPARAPARRASRPSRLLPVTGARAALSRTASRWRRLLEPLGGDSRLRLRAGAETAPPSTGQQPPRAGAASGTGGGRRGYRFLGRVSPMWKGLRHVLQLPHLSLYGEP